MRRKVRKGVRIVLHRVKAPKRFERSKKDPPPYFWEKDAMLKILGLLGQFVSIIMLGILQNLWED